MGIYPKEGERVFSKKQLLVQTGIGFNLLEDPICQMVLLTCLAGLKIAATQNQVARIFEIRQQSRWHPAFDMTAASTELTSVGGGFAETVPLH